ncbi:hypothetical protein AXF42_Ash017509 [Apostasia shenzhenica]|uniref:POTRA domain-containing protein n=1 Tax=Apostasia shenzhenica TaxID=1088818 RepID=A0A2I0A362_9ASPA|nr:hypothetical protein AXF42_Ash017509 [Apostasia shenzhenica]
MASVVAGDGNSIRDEGELEDSYNNGNGGDADEEEDAGEEDDFDEDEIGSGGRRLSDRERMSSLLRRLSKGPMRLHVHDVIIRGNTKTKDSLIEAEVLQLFRSATSMQELLQAASAANARLQRLDIFDSVSIVLDAGPPELPGTANIIIEVAEPRNPLSADIGIYTRPETRGWSFEGLVKLKNIFGYGDIWNAAGAYGWDQAIEMSTGLSLPRFKAFSTPLSARLSLLTHDWLKFSSYKERQLGLSFGLVSTMRHDLIYNLTWRHLTDPTYMASKSVKRQLGHSLLSTVKYTYKLDQRDSSIRPTSGYAFLSMSQICGLGPDSNLLRYMRQTQPIHQLHHHLAILCMIPSTCPYAHCNSPFVKPFASTCSALEAMYAPEFDLRLAIPLGFFNTALNFGFAAGVIMPWGNGLKNSTTRLPDRFHLSGNTSPLCLLGGPTSLFGFKSRGLGPSEIRRFIPSKPDGSDGSPANPDRDALGGDLAITAFADLSFDLPLRVLRDSGIHGHAFIAAGNVTELLQGSLKDFSIRRFAQEFRSSAGCGVVVPTKLFRMEVNYCYILRQFEHDKGKTGIQFCFSPPS